MPRREQAQQIDWLTMQVEPGIEARFDWLTVEYTRTMRSFQQRRSDGAKSVQLRNLPTHPGFNGLPPRGVWNMRLAYGCLRVRRTTPRSTASSCGSIGDYTDAYVMGFVGNTHNDFRDSDRKF